MNSTLKLAIRFLISIFIFFLLLNLLSVPILIAEGPQKGGWYFWGRLVSLWKPLLVGSVILGLLTVHLSFLRMRSPLFPQLVLLFVGTLFLYGSLFTLQFIHVSYTDKSARPYRIATPDTIFYASGKYVWVGTPQEWVLKPILVFSPNQKERLKVFPEALYDPETNAVHILQTGENLSLHERISRKEPRVLSILWKNIAYFSKLISPAHIFDSRALLYSTSFILFLVSLHTVMRSSRWILFNFILALSFPLCTTGILRLADQILGTAVVEILGTQLTFYLPVILHGGIAVLCFILQIFMRPFDEWRRSAGFQ